MSKYTFLIWKNLLRNRRRSILTVLSMAISLFLISILFSIYAMFYFRDIGEDSVLRLVTRHKVSLTQVLPFYYGARIAEIDGVENFSPMNWFGGTYIDYQPYNMFPRFAVNPETIFDIYGELKIPPEQLEAFQRDRQAIAIGKSVSERAGIELGQTITITGDIYPFNPEFRVQAIFDGPEDFQSFFHFKYLEEALGPERGSAVGVFALRLRSAGDASRVAQVIDDMFRNSPEPTKTETEAAFQMSFINQLGNIKLFLLSIASAVVFTMLMVSANTIAMAVRERTREIGVLKTLGYPSGTILNLVLGEATAIALLGGILGVGGAYIITSALEDMMVMFFTGFGLPPWAVPICMAISLIVGLGSSAFPAILASRTKTVDALRFAG